MWLLAGVRLLRALRMSHRLTFFTLPTARAVSFVVLGCCCLCWLFVFCMCSRHLFDHSCGCIQNDRQCLIARSAVLKKNGSPAKPSRFTSRSSCLSRVTLIIGLRRWAPEKGPGPWSHPIPARFYGVCHYARSPACESGR